VRSTRVRRDEGEGLWPRLQAIRYPAGLLTRWRSASAQMPAAAFADPQTAPVSAVDITYILADTTSAPAINSIGCRSGAKFAVGISRRLRCGQLKGGSIMAIRRATITLAVLAVLGVSDVVVAAGPSDGLQVNVVNTPTNPVPVTVTNPSTAPAATIVTNPATMPVPVIVTNPSTGPAATIITNSATMPALTSSIDDPGRNPFQVATSKSCGGGLGCNIDFPPVPVGHRLVVQQVSCSTTYTGSPPYVAVSVEENVSPFVRSSFFAPFSGGVVLFTQHLTYYLNENATLDVGISLGGTATIGPTQCSLTGYLVNCGANQCSAIVAN